MLSITAQLRGEVDKASQGLLRDADAARDEMLARGGDLSSQFATITASIRWRPSGPASS